MRTPLIHGRSKVAEEGLLYLYTVGKIIIILGYGRKIIISRSFSAKLELIHYNFNADFATILIAESSD